MTDQLLLAIDAGTGSCRAVVFDPEGHQLAIGQREWSHATLPDAPGSQEFDTTGNWALICECVHEVLATSGISADAVAAVSSTSMREGMVLYDSSGDAIWACPNVDSRAGAEAVELIESGDARTIYFQGGDWVSITSPARFRWIARHQPEIFGSIAHVGMLSDWILTRLSGEFVTDPSAGSSSGMFELAHRDWSDRVIDLVELPREVLPPVRDPGTVIGEVTAKAAAETGLREGTPVVVGGADTQLALVGIGLTQPHKFTVIGGSFWQATVTSDQVLIDPECRLRTLCHTVPGQWMMEGIGFYSGLSMRWFRDGFCDAEKAAAAEAGTDPYMLMEQAAAQAPPGSGGVVGLFSNVMDAKRWVQTAPGFLGFDIANPAASGKKECIRAIEEAAAYAVRGHYEIAAQVAGRQVDEVVFTGGASNGTLWPRILADVLGVPVHVPEVRESTALGAAMYAAVGAGIAADVADLATTGARMAATYEPDPTVGRTYSALYDQWREVYRHSLEMVDAEVIRPLWRPAGA